MTIDPSRPHLPNPDATAISLLEQGIADRDETIAAQWAELQSTRRRLEQAVATLNELTHAKESA